MSDQAITPTPGRAVWYYPSQHEIDAKTFAYGDQTQPLAATVAYVWHDRMVNLSVIDQNGSQFRRTSVLLVQPGDEAPLTSQQPYAAWMPYQINAAKAQADVGKTGEAPRFKILNESAANKTGEELLAELQKFKPAPHFVRRWVLLDGQWQPTDEVSPVDSDDHPSLPPLNGDGAMSFRDVVFPAGVVRLWVNGQPDAAVSDGWQDAEAPALWHTGTAAELLAKLSSSAPPADPIPEPEKAPAPAKKGKE